jgi:hypothetical protein
VLLGKPLQILLKYSGVVCSHRSLPLLFLSYRLPSTHDQPFERLKRSC